MMTTWLRSGLGFLRFLRQRGDEIKQVAHHAVVGDLEDRRLGIFINGDDGARALHAHNMLDGAADADGQVKFWRNRLAGAADLAVHGQPAGIAYGTRRGNLAAQRVGQRLGQLDVLLLLDAAAHGDNNLGLGKIDGLFGFLERLFRLIADDTVRNLYVHGFYRSG